MSDQIIEMPDCYDVTGDASAEADAALDPQPTPPADCAVAEDKKGNKYERWAETVKIENTSMGRSPKGHTSFLIEAKILPNGTPGQKNVGKRIYTRLAVSFSTLEAQRTGQEVDSNMVFMNNRSIGTLQSLLRATGYAPTEPGLKAALLKALFPLESDPIKNTPLIGKTVVVNVVRSKSKGGKYPFDVRGEMFLPTPTA